MKAVLVPVTPLGILVRAKVRAVLRQTPVYRQIPAATWRQIWVVGGRPVGTGAATLRYLVPYVLREPLSNKRIVGVQDWPDDVSVS